MCLCPIVHQSPPARRDVISSWSSLWYVVMVKEEMKVLLLLLVILSSNGHPIDDSNRHKLISCHNKEMSIICASHRTIHVSYAMYGRLSWSDCPVNTSRDQARDIIPCSSSKSLQVVTERCNNQVSCKLQSTPATFGSAGTCNHLLNYLEVQFECVANSPPPTAQPVVLAPLPTPRRPVQIPVSDACPATNKRNIQWPKTPAGQWAYVTCPDSALSAGRNASWYCNWSPVSWNGTPDMKNCVGRKMSALHAKLSAPTNKFEPTDIEAMVGELTQVARSKDKIHGGDLDLMTDTLDVVTSRINVKLLKNNESELEMKGTLRKVYQSVMATSDELLCDSFAETWHDLRPRDRQRAASRILRSLESSAFYYARTFVQNTSKTTLGDSSEVTLTNITDNIALELSTVGGSLKNIFHFPKNGSLRGSRWQNVRNRVQLSSRALKSLTGKGKGRLNIMFAMFNNLETWLAPISNTDAVQAVSSAVPSSVNNVVCPGDSCVPDNIVNTNIITVSVGFKQAQSTSLDEPIRFVLEHKQTGNVSNPQCSFWKFSDSSAGGEWSTEGCRLVETNFTHTTCECDHLTSFAVLMSPTAPALSQANEIALSVITYIGCMISILCLGFAFLTFQFCKSVQGDRNTVHKNLVINLFVANVLFLSGISAYTVPVLCAIVAGFLHYFFLTSFSWMCLEGIQLYVMLVEVFEAERSRIRWYYLSGYGVPALIVAISAAVYHQGYGTPYYCWLSVERGFIWAFIAPVICVLVVNAGMLGIALRAMYQHTKMAASWRKEKTKVQQMRSWVKGALVLEVLLGLTWAFGISFVNAQTIAFAYIFTILNSLQGTFIFVFHCVMNEKVRHDYQRFIRHCKCLPESFRVRFGGARMSMSTMPNQSNSSGGGNYLNRLLPSRRRHSSSSTSLSKSNSISNRKSVAVVKDDLAVTNNAAVTSLVATDSGIDDPSSYLEPSAIRFGESEFDDGGQEMSMIEGSVVDTNYVLSMTRPSSEPSQSTMSDVPFDPSTSETRADHSADLPSATSVSRIESELPSDRSRRPKMTDSVARQTRHSRRENQKSRSNSQEPMLSAGKSDVRRIDEDSDTTADSAVRDLSISTTSQSLHETNHSLLSAKVTSC